MSACKSHQRQIALLSVQALNESETSTVRDHLRKCATCREYARQLESIVGLYIQDAERPLAPSTAAAPRFEARPVPWFTLLLASPRLAMAGLAALIVCAALLLMRNRPERDLPRLTIASPAPIIPSIGNLRHLTSAELEELTQPAPARTSSRAEFVFSVRTRDDGS